MTMSAMRAGLQTIARTGILIPFIAIAMLHRNMPVEGNKNRPEGMTTLMETVMHKLFSVSIVICTIASPLYAEAPHMFKSDGVTYEYEAHRSGPENILISGRVREDNTPFQFTVHRRRVTGVVGRDSVSFGISRTVRDRLDAEVTGTALASK